MHDLAKKYNDFITSIILAQKSYGFTSISELESLKYMRFDYEDYPSAKKLIEEGNWQHIKGQEQTTTDFREYLEIVRFKDQNGQTFNATIYDSDALEQGPQIIDIFLL